MAWIESHQELVRHPKTRRLMRFLGVPLPAVIGHLHLFWWWALDYAQDGNLARYSAEDIADAAMWDGPADAFVDAMCNAGFIDRSPEGALRIHDWEDYAGRLLEKRREDAERKRKARGGSQEDKSETTEASGDGVGTSGGHPADVQRTSDGHPADIQRTSDGHPADVQRTAQVTVPNRTSTVPNASATTGENQTADPAAATADVVDINLKRVQQAFTKAFGDLPNRLVVDELMSFIEDGMAPEVVEEALRRAAEANARSWKYALRILNDWIEAQAFTLADVHALDAARTRASPQKREPYGGPCIPGIEATRELLARAEAKRLRILAEAERKQREGG